MRICYLRSSSRRSSALNRRTAAIAGAVLLAAVVASHAAIAPQLNWGKANWGSGALGRTLAEFTAGIFVYRFYRSGSFRSQNAAFLTVMAAICGAFYYGLPDGVTVLLLLMLLLAAVANTGRIGAFLENKPLRWLGDISYAVYISQTVAFLPIVFAFDALLATHGFGGIWFQAFAALSALACGALVHRRIEAPARAALRHLPGRIAVAAGARRRPRTGAAIGPAEKVSTTPTRYWRCATVKPYLRKIFLR